MKFIILYDVGHTLGIGLFIGLFDFGLFGGQSLLERLLRLGLLSLGLSFLSLSNFLNGLSGFGLLKS